MDIQNKKLNQKLKPLCQDGKWSISILDLNNKADIFSFNEKTPFVLASNQKIFSLLAAYKYLGKNYHSNTNIYHRGAIKDNILNGDLIIEGNGGIFFSSRYPHMNSIKQKNKIIRKQLEYFANQLKRHGVKEITGDIILDSSNWTDMKKNHHYNSASAFTFNENTIDVSVKNSRLEHCPSALWGFDLLCQQPLKAAFQKRIKDSDKIQINLLKNSNDYWRLETHDPMKYYYFQIRKYLLHKGFIIKEGNNKLKDHLKKKLFHLKGMPVRDFFESVLSYSDNLRAELLFLQLGFKMFGKANYANSRKAILNIFSQDLLDLKHYEPFDGSGLDSRNQASAQDMVTVLNHIYNLKEFKLFQKSLAVSGVKGTLSSHLKHSTLKGNIFAKTGTHDNVKTLSGYLFYDNKKICFSFLSSLITRKKFWHTVENCLLEVIRKQE